MNFLKDFNDYIKDFLDLLWDFIDSLEDGKQPHAHVMAHYDLHHVRLLEVGLWVA